MSSNEYMNEYMKKRYRERRTRALWLLGNECVKCGATENLDLDHIDPSEKTFNFSKIWSGSLAKFDAELTKAQILCMDCHVKKSKEEKSVGHGGGLSGKKNCPCELCRIKKAEYMRNYRKTHGR